MLRTARRLRLESCEDRSLPSALASTPRPPVDTAHTSTAPEPAEDEATEYADSGQPLTRTPNRPAETARALVPDYVVAAYPAIPPIPAEPGAPPTPAVTPPGPPVAPNPVPGTAAIAAAASPAIQPAPPPPAIPERAAVAPPDDGPDDGPIEAPSGFPAGSGDQPAVADLEFPPVGAVSAGVLGVGELDLCVNLAGWSATAGRLLDGLDAVPHALDAESPWVRLGYWVLAIGTVGVTVELTRQGLRPKPPDPLQGPAIPVTR
jgi:hypothetical protein